MLAFSTSILKNHPDIYKEDGPCFVQHLVWASRSLFWP